MDAKFDELKSDIVKCNKSISNHGVMMDHSSSIKTLESKVVQIEKHIASKKVQDYNNYKTCMKYDLLSCEVKEFRLPVINYLNNPNFSWSLFYSQLSSMLFRCSYVREFVEIPGKLWINSYFLNQISLKKSLWNNLIMARTITIIDLFQTHCRTD